MKPFTIIDVPQRSPEWIAARLGRLTGSITKAAYAQTTKKEWSADRRNLVMRLALERLTNRSLERNFVSPAMQDGIDREPEAIRAFEALTGELVEQTGFLSHNDLYIGASLDGHMGDFETLLSIKCRQANAHWEFYRSRKVPADALTQIRHELFVTGAERHIYFEWNPDFPPKAQHAMVTVARADANMGEYSDRCHAFLAEVEAEYSAMRTVTDLEAVLTEATA